MTKTAVILAAGPLSPSMAAIWGRTSSAMVPVSGRPTIHWVLSHLREFGIRRVVLGIREAETRLPRFVEQAFGEVMDLTWVRMDEDRGPGFTLLHCLDRVRGRTPCLVVLGDTIFELSKPVKAWWSENFVVTGPVPDAARWCLVKVDSKGLVRGLSDKQPKNPDGWPALIGVYHFRDCGPARDALRAAAKIGSGSIQLRHALKPYIKRGNLRAFRAKEWLDCGNLDFLTSSRRRLLQSRSFNSIKIDELRGTLNKQSRHVGKFLNEINYYRLLPRDLATFFPRLVDFELSSPQPRMTLEYYGYPTLSEMWVFEEFDSAYWKNLFKTLRRIVSCFESYRVEIPADTVYEFYWGKTERRISEFKLQGAMFARLVGANRIELNGCSYRGWPRIREAVRRLVTALAKRPRGHVIHGDLCFPNILYDPVSRLFKFIDPRGSFGDAGLFGDTRYDVAKLLHSIDGGYDFLIHDMYRLERKGRRFSLQMFFPVSRPAVINAFSRVFLREFPLSEIRLIEGLLFVSMCSLHADNPSRQTAMFVTGLRILNEVILNEDMR